MINTLINILKMFIAILPMAFLFYKNKNVNLPKHDRSKQFLMPIISVVYSLAAMVLAAKISGWILALIRYVPIAIASLAKIPFLPQEAKDFFVRSGKDLYEYFKGLNLNYWVFIIANFAILLVYLLVKKICLSLMKRYIKNDSKIHVKVADRFYEYLLERDCWCIKDENAHLRKLLKVFYIWAVVISSFLMIIAYILYSKELLKVAFYPVFGTIIIGEMYFYLDGLTKREYVHNILGEDENAYKTVNYSLLRKFLRSVFGDKLMTENTTVNNDIMNDVTNDEVIHDLEKSEDQKITSFAAYIKALNASGFDLDQKYVYSSLDLLKGKSILFNNPFYNDLIPYAFYPMNRVLLSHKKVLVVLGRHSIEEDIVKWLEQGIQAVTNIPFMWKMNILNSEYQDTDIGIITRSDVLNIKLHNANTEFLKDVGFVVIIEPSKLIPTAQIGLNLLVKHCRQKNNKIVYCMCDKNCDGLVDAMSHILMTSIEEVSATKKHKGTSSYMCWETDEEYLHHRICPNISRYLGVGTELSFAALQNQVDKTSWYGGESFPVKDMNWISKQYYHDLMNYAGLPTSPEEMDRHFYVSSNFWSAGMRKHNYFTIEDESCNMFEILRNFETRSKEQGFINIISPEYMFKDYMADNAVVFEADPKAIPNIVADYARTNRNMILRLLLMMSTYPVKETVLRQELSLFGVKALDLKTQLWFEIYKCFASVNDLAALSNDYIENVKAIADRTLVVGDKVIGYDVIRTKEQFNVYSGRIERTYVIEDEDFIYYYIKDLKSAGYVAEDEKGDKYYLGTELSGHIYQKYLPGQFFTFAGKYYEMLYLTADNQVLVRRAADHINGRPSYRQIRDYKLCAVRESERIASHQNVAGMRISRWYADIEINTPGYYQMQRYNDFTTAKKIIYEGSYTRLPMRKYNNKEILKLQFPGKDVSFSNTVRYTITVLLNEMFKTLFAENSAYICALTDTQFLTPGTKINPLTYTIHADGDLLDPNAIYIVEDSQLDLGLTVAVERNLYRILEMAYDYLDWNQEAIEKSLNPEPDPVPPVVFGLPEDEPEEAKEPASLWGKIKAFFKKIWNRLFGKKKEAVSTEAKLTEDAVVPEEKSTEETVDTQEQPTEETADTQEQPTEETADAEEKSAKESQEVPTVNASSKDDDDRKMFKRKKYHERYYFLFGADDEPECIDLSNTLAYLLTLGLDNNQLKQARDGKNIADYVAENFKPEKAGSRYCDFCGTEIYGVEYETLADGRDRCMRCGRTAIKTEKEFCEMFNEVKRNMESFFGIKIHAGIRVQMVNSKKLHKCLGEAFIPTPNADGRILGVAISDKNGYTLMIENGSPRMASMLTMAHELTHIWQYINWNDKELRMIYGSGLYLQVYEGMAKWVEIQYAYLINEPARAKREELITSYRADEYGYGFLRYVSNYPFSTGTVIVRPTPFENIKMPLDPAYCGPIKRTIYGTGANVSETEVKDGTDVQTGDKIDGAKERTPGEISYYAYNLLNSDEKKVYDLMLDAIKGYKQEISSLDVAMNSADIYKISHYVQHDHPEIFWFYYGITIYTESTGKVVKIGFSYNMTFDEMKRRQKKLDLAQKAFLSSVTDNMSDYEVVLRVYENIIRLVDYDSVELEKVEKVEKAKGKGTAEKRFDLSSIYGALVNKKAVCAGYAKATQYLLNLCGIECLYVTSDTHAWNMVKIEGEYYHLDTTWGDGSNTKKELNHSSEIGYNYFCVTTDEIVKIDDHMPNKDLPLPESTATACNYHHRHGLYFEQYNEARMKLIIKESVRRRRNRISIKCANDEVYKECYSELVSKGGFLKMLGESKGTVNCKWETSISKEDKLRILTFEIRRV